MAGNHDSPGPRSSSIPYPAHPLAKYLAKSPILLWRLGLGALVGRLFMIITSTGRKSGRPRRAPVEYHIWKGRKYVLAAWPQSDWYRNLQANPHVTIQTAAGAEGVVARRLSGDAELKEAYGLIAANAEVRAFWRWLGFGVRREEFLAQREAFHLLTFDPTAAPTPPPLAVDLLWVWPLLLVGALMLRPRRRRK